LDQMSHSLGFGWPPKGQPAKLFENDWGELEKQLPGSSFALQSYLRKGVFYVLDNIKYLPILPIAAEEKGLKTRFPTCSLTAANMVQQILRRVLDYIMVNDPRFSQALGGHLDIDLSGELGSWYSQDASAATDLHAEWLTRTPYEVITEHYPVLRPYSKYFDKLFGTKKLLLDIDPGELMPSGMFEFFPSAPFIDVFVDGFDERVTAAGGQISDLIIQIMDDWISDLNDLPGTLTSTGQMMGDPTSFSPSYATYIICSNRGP